MTVLLAHVDKHVYCGILQLETLRMSRNKRFITEFQHLQHFSRESSKLATDSFSFREERISKFRKIVHRKSPTISRQFSFINRSSLRTANDKINPKGGQIRRKSNRFPPPQDSKIPKIFGNFEFSWFDQLLESPKLWNNKFFQKYQIFEIPEKIHPL